MKWEERLSLLLCAMCGTCISLPVEGPPALDALLYTSESVVPTSCAHRTSSSTCGVGVGMRIRFI
jgi:hypothetical protein